MAKTTTSRLRYGLLGLSWFFVFGFSALSIWQISAAFTPTDFLDEAILGIGFGLFAVYGWYSVLLEINHWTISGDEVCVRDCAGLRIRRFPKSEVLSWEERDKATKYNHWKELVLKTRTSRYRLFSSGVHNYEALKAELISTTPAAAYPETTTPQQAVSKKKYLWLGFALLVFGGIWTYVDVSQRSAGPLPQACFKAVLSQAPVHETGSRDAAWVHFPVKEFPELQFSIDHNDGSYQATAVNALRRDVHAGDSVTLCVDPADYHVFITRSQPPGFWQRAAGFGSIRVIGIEHKNRVYLNSARIRDWENSEPGPWILPLGFGLLLLLIGFFAPKTEAA
ncbi:MAG: hypothetical protein RLZZ370_1767 [Bacteroidota bacterium]|jgi:hypothetical protein